MPAARTDFTALITANGWGGYEEVDFTAPRSAGDIALRLEALKAAVTSGYRDPLRVVAIKETATGELWYTTAEYLLTVE